MIFALPSFLLLEWFIFDHVTRRGVGGLISGPKHLFLPLTATLLIPLACWQAYQRIKDDISADSDIPEFLDVVKKHIVSLMGMVLLSCFLLLVVLYGH